MKYIINLKEPVKLNAQLVTNSISCDSYDAHVSLGETSLGVTYAVGTARGWIPYTNILGITVAKETDAQ